jgi:DNA-binding NarL/FixJ family response regulator
MFTSPTHHQKALPPIVAAAVDDLAALLLQYRVRIELIEPNGRTTRVHAYHRSQRTPMQELLTACEWRVATLVATGSTNREVAGRLTISHKTVEAHLGHIYRKAGVRSRSELAFRVAQSLAVPGMRIMQIAA